MPARARLRPGGGRDTEDENGDGQRVGGAVGGDLYLIDDIFEWKSERGCRVGAAKGGAVVEPAVGLPAADFEGEGARGANGKLVAEVTAGPVGCRR